MSPAPESKTDRAILTLLRDALRGVPSLPETFTDLDPEEFLSGASLHGVLPLLFRQTRHQALRDAARESAQRGLAMASELAEILRESRARGLRVLPYKGPVLGARLWDDPALRPCRDLDLIVDEPDRAGLTELLRRRGYAPAAEHAADHHEGWQHKDFGLVVEAHHALVPAIWPLRLPLGELWHGSTTVDLLGHRVEAMAAETEMIVLAVHAARHGWCHLLWLTDLARLTDQGFDAAVTLRRARALGVERIVLLGAELTRRLFQIDPPPEFEERILADEVVGDLAPKIAARLPDGRRPRGLEYHRLQLAQRERHRDRLRYLLRLRRRRGGLPSGEGLSLLRT